VTPPWRFDTDGGSAAREPGVITFDGPAASGKSSVAQRVALALGIPFVSSGLLYRAATHLVERSGTDAGDQAAVLALLGAHRVELRPDVTGNDVLVDGVPVTVELHTDRVDAVVSTVAGHPQVRAWVSEQLRRVPPPFVIDGRDMGSVVFPRARHKFYLTASAEERARRRVGERAADLAAVAAAIARRDLGDARQLAPAADAVHVDTDGLDLDQVVARVLASIRASDARAVAS
jgi:CMP/dCMP kinase